MFFDLKFIRFFIKMTIANLFYRNQRYQINIETLKEESEYFRELQMTEDLTEINIPLLTEFESNINLKEETVEQFIEYFHTSDIDINNDNVFDLQFLSKKYEITKLRKKTDKHIKNNYKQLIDSFLTNKKSKYFEEETLLSSHLIEYIKDDRLHELPLQILYRIFKEYSQSKKHNQKPTEKSEDEKDEENDSNPKQRLRKKSKE